MGQLLVGKPGDEFCIAWHHFAMLVALHIRERFVLAPAGNAFTLPASARIAM